MTTKNYGQTGVGSTLQYGKNGPLINSVSGTFEAKDPTNSSFVTFSVATPTSGAHAATKAYVDAFIQGLDFKQSVDYATIAALPAVTYANGTLGFGATLTEVSSGALSVDGASPTVGQRILVKNQVAALQNGIYVVTDAGSGGSPFILTRATDADNSPANEVSGGMFAFVTTGGTLADTGWVLSSPNGAAVLGTDALVFVQFSSAGVVTVGAGSALDQTGTALSVRVDGTTIGINAVGNGQLIARSTSTQGQTLVSDGTAGNAAVWNFIPSLKGATTGRLIVSGVDSGGANTNYLTVTTSNGTASPIVTVQATNASGGGDAANVDLVIGGKGTGVIAVSSNISTLSNANLFLTPNGTGLVAVGAAITTISNANLKLTPNGTGIIEANADINVFANTIRTTTTNGDIKFLPNGTGVLSVSGTTNYETNVTDDDDIPNKKYVDDAIVASTPSYARRAVITADGTNDSFNIGVVLPTVSGKITYVTRVILDVTTIFAGGSVNKAKVTDGSNILMAFDENDILITGIYIADLPLAVTSTGAQVVIEFYLADGTTPAIPVTGSVISTVFFEVI